MSYLRFRVWLLQYATRRFFSQTLPFWLAYRVPRKLALLVFVRVYAVLGELGPDYERVYKAWEAKA